MVMSMSMTVQEDEWPEGVVEGSGPEEEVNPFKEGRPAPEDPAMLPPIHHIREPKMQHMSTRIRWYLALGYAVKEVSKLLGVRYQQVRNVKTVEPKRAAREDLPPLWIVLHDVQDDLEAMDAHALEMEMAQQRAESRSAKRQANAARRALKGAAGEEDLGAGEEEY